MIIKFLNCIFTMRKLFIIMIAALFLLTNCRKEEKLFESANENPDKESRLDDFLSDSFFPENNKYYKPSTGNTGWRSKSEFELELKDYFRTNSDSISWIIENWGYPVWSHAVMMDSLEAIYFLPFAKLDSSKISGSLIVRKNVNEFNFKFINRNNISGYAIKSNLVRNQEGKYQNISRELAIVTTIYFEYTIFQEIDCNLVDEMYNIQHIRQGDERGCYVQTYVTTTTWNVYINGVYAYSDYTYSYSYEIICWGGYQDSGSAPPNNDNTNSEGSNSNNNNTNTNDQNEVNELNNCRFLNPDVLLKIKELENQKFHDLCRNGREFNINYNDIERELCKSGNYTMDGLNSALDSYIGSSAADNATLYDFYKNTDLVNPCTGEAIDKDGIFKSLCEKGKMSMSGLDEALDGVEQIAINLNQFNSCPKLICALKEILINKSISTTMIKDFCEKFDKKGLPIIAIGTQDFSTIGLPSNALAVTTIKFTDLGRPFQVMQFNTLSCNTNPDPLDIIETFQHESIHAKIKDKLINKYGWDGHEATRQTAFLAMMADEYPGNPSISEHQLMLTVYLQEFKDALMAANGGLGLPLPAPNNSDIYLGAIFNGYSDELPFIASQLGYTHADITLMVNNYNLWIRTNQSPAGIYGKCP